MEYLVSACTVTGIGKAVNQDAFCFRRAVIRDEGEVLMAVVCDGMGGLQKGELASAVCARTFGAWFDNNLLNLSDLCRADFSQVQQQWSEMIQNIHQRLATYSSDNGLHMGATITAMLTYRTRYITVNVGDSRIYEHNGLLRQITQDQSLVAMEVSSGRITEDESRHHPQRNILLQCIGSGGSVSPVFTQGSIRGEALYLLCTDGLVHEVSLAELTDHLMPMKFKSKEGLFRSITDLVEVCRQRGEHDDITAILIKADESRYDLKFSSRMRQSLQKLLHKNQPECASTALIESAQMEHAQEKI